MLSIIAPTAVAISGQAIHRATSAYYAQVSPAADSLISGILSACAVPSTIAEIDKVVASDPVEDRPTEETIRRAKHFLEEAHVHSPVYLTASEVESFEGDLLIHWTTPNKRIAIISPHQQNQPLKLYKTISSGWSNLMSNPSPVDLNLALQWVMQQ